ncbi:hypothetical protein SDRG_00946 [Saprolegnia diclina VS20]|uniref:Uncharacterized protein n=1 Tax=Saprolegnia diclina (strain VS20) TaxID=1156394 RepID=T0R6M1_SAPDV|nr:hypothetical protein SDRG_00946 [Saprolegnia diclina VS20]EQC42105.1 hypothetical protein SDRG_00946 [Saprolegnia diclina VS20]|eukprot:XP_008604674.1 hypothetical protein SDRG_00946 [Saprolegnia diclina VS20]
MGRFTTWLHLESAVGLLYVLLSLACCVYYTRLLKPTFANDLWWAGYNVSGYQAFLIDLVNQFLMTQANGTLDVLFASAMVPKTYATIDAFTSIYTPYMHGVCSSASSRPSSTPCQSFHCWVDFNKTFEMAHTERRQERCERNYRTNAAVYLEAILRNQNWDAYLALWAGNGLRFNVAIQRGLQETIAGRSFLSQMATAANTTSVADELTYWRSYNLSIFELQWQSRWQPGVSETIIVSNALGMQENFTLKALDQVTGPWSSQSLFWMPLNDLYNGMTLNRSLIRGSSRHFATNISAALPAINLETYRGMADSRGNLVGKAWVFHTFIGPYLSIDIRYKLRPSPLVAAYNRFQDVVLEHLATSAARFESFASLPSVVLTPTPSRWKSNYTFYGGDPMCVLGSGTSYVQQSFDFYDDCSQKTPLSVQPPPMSLLFALPATSTTSSAAFSMDVICTLSIAPNPCTAALSAASNWLKELPIPLDVSSTLESLPPMLQATDTSFMQFDKASNGSWLLLQQPLLGSLDDPWTFYGWCFAADWATGLRQAASFEGDVSSIVLLSNAYTSQHYITSGQPLETATKMIYYLVLASTICLVGVGGLALLYTFYSHFDITGRNLLCFNRLVGSVWAGRQLMLMRGISAILILSTAQPKLVTQFGYSRLVDEARSFWATGLLAGEATWLSYSLHEYLVIALPKPFTRLYGPWTNALAWLTILVLSLVSPVGIAMNLSRTCVGNDMDYGLLCTAGAISIGSLNRLVLLCSLQVGIVVASIGLGCGVRRLCGAEKDDDDEEEEEQESLLVSGLAEAFITADPRCDAGRVYDPVTCVLCGLLPLSYNGHRYIFDLKLWSLLPDTISTHVARAAPEASLVATQSHITSTAFSVPSMDLIRVASGRRRLRTLLAAFGLLYMSASITGSVLYFEVCKVNLDNDLYWATFNVTGAHTFFANWLNEQLILRATAQNIVLNDPSINLLGSYATPTAFVSTVNNYGAWLQHNELSAIEASIAGLRVSDACNAPWIFTPYCYLDWKKRWSMAYSNQRQLRCQKMEENAAVYLESVLRNIDYATFAYFVRRSSLAAFNGYGATAAAR